MSQTKSPRKKIVIVGATSAIAEHCARLWVCEPEPSDLILLGRNQEKLASLAMDLRVRNPQARITAMTTHFLESLAIENTFKEITQDGPIHYALIAHGHLPAQEECQKDLKLCEETLTINGLSPILFAECCIKHMVSNNSGTLGILSSVAGDRARRSNYVYGSAKCLVSFYTQGLQHRLANSPIKVVLIKPGPTDTPMAAHLKQKGCHLASPEHVAQIIVRAMEKGQRIVYAPTKWRLIMGIIRHIPDFIFDKMNI